MCFLVSNEEMFAREERYKSPLTSKPQSTKYSSLERNELPQKGFELTVKINKLFGFEAINY